MFDIGFTEIFLVAVVALVVIGPERLPGVARNIGRFAGRLQRYVHDIKRDFNREVEFEEIRRLQHEMETTVQSMQESMRVVESSLKKEALDQQTALLDAVAELDATASSVVETAAIEPDPGEPAAVKAPPKTRKRTSAKIAKEAGTKAGTKVGTKAATKAATKAVTAAGTPVSTNPPAAPMAPLASATPPVSADDDQFRLF